jgi:hypothetical protein
MIRTLLLIVGFFFAGVIAYATYKENYSISNYDECILKSMKSVDSETTAKSLKKACSSKYEDSVFDKFSFKKKEEISTDKLEKTIIKLTEIMKIMKRELNDSDKDEKKDQ